jgi:hypothetical protein
MLWHAPMFLGLRPTGLFPPFSLYLIGGFDCFFLYESFKLESTTNLGTMPVTRAITNGNILYVTN